MNTTDVLRSYSTEDGIVYYANSGVCLKVERDGDRINKYILEKRFLECCGEIPWDSSAPTGWENREWLLLSIAIAIIGFVFGGVKGLVYALIFGVLVLEHFIPTLNMIILSRVVKNKAYVDMARYRGAERKVQNAYRKKGEIPTIDEARAASRIVKENNLENYGYTSFIVMMIYCISLFVVYFIFPELVLLLIAVLIGEFIILSKFRTFGSFFQQFTTLEPNDEELELSIAGLEFYQLYQNSDEEAYAEMAKNLEPIAEEMIEICEKNPDKLNYDLDIESIKFHQRILRKVANGEYTSEKNLRTASAIIFFLYYEILH